MSMLLGKVGRVGVCCLKWGVGEGRGEGRRAREEICTARNNDE